MTDPRKKPFHSIEAADDVDRAIEEIARAKGVPALSAARGRNEETPRGRAGEAMPAAGKLVVSAPAPRKSYVKAAVPEYALIALKMRAAEEQVTLNHILLKALRDSGIPIRDEDLIEDGRRATSQGVS